MYLLWLVDACSFLSWYFKILKQGVVIQRHLFCDRHYTITKIFCFTLSYVINKQGDDPSGVTLLLEAENCSGGSRNCGWGVN